MKKKIRAIQYGVGPIGASIAKLLREKQSVEICGAIDNDPAKVGRDLGEVVGASDAPWGVTVSDNAEEVLSQAADIVMHTTSSSLEKVADQLIECLKAGSCVVSTCEELSYPYRTHPELAEQIDKEASSFLVRVRIERLLARLLEIEDRLWFVVGGLPMVRQHGVHRKAENGIDPEPVDETAVGPQEVVEPHRHRSGPPRHGAPKQS